MKVSIAYQPGEEKEAVLIQRFADSLLGGTKIHKSDRHLPFKHIYLSTKKHGDPYVDSNIACNVAQDMV